MMSQMKFGNLYMMTLLKFHMMFQMKAAHEFDTCNWHMDRDAHGLGHMSLLGLKSIIPEVYVLSVKVEFVLL